MLVYPNKVIVFASDIGRYTFCPKQLYMELKHGKVQTKMMAKGVAKHKEIEDKEKESSEHLEHVQNLMQALEMSKTTSKIIESVDEYKMQDFVDGVLLIGKPDLIAAHKSDIMIIERKPHREREELRKGELLQIATYALLAQKETRLSYDKIKCYIDFYDRETAKIIKRARVPILPEHTYEVRKILKDMQEIAEGKVPEATFYPKKCAYCGYKELCENQEPQF